MKTTINSILKMFILCMAMLTVSCSKPEEPKPVTPEPICIMQQCVATTDGTNRCPNWTVRCNRLCDTHKNR